MPRPRIRLISRDNGVGLSRDLNLMGNALAGHAAVERAGLGSHGTARWQELGLWCKRLVQGRAQAQIFAERVYRHCLPLAEHNLLVPNPEWFLQRWLPHLPAFEAVLCKTRHAERIFRGLGCDTRHIGFTSDDRLLPDVPRRRAFLHLAGRSSAKGTQVLLRAWQQHPHWPLLVVVQHPRMAGERITAPNIDHHVGWMDEAQLRRLQNACRFHICPSETEGFGHYLMEGLSVGAIVLATDGEPMNELVNERCGIPIATARVAADHLVRRHYVDVDGIADAVEKALAMDEPALQRLSRNARASFVANDRAFAQRFRGEVMRFVAEPGSVPVAGRG